MQRKLQQFFCFLGLGLLGGNTYAYNFSDIYFFGDSLTDVGNSPLAPLINGNGNLWSDVVAEHYGIDNSPSNPLPWHKEQTPGNNFAYVGKDTNYLVNTEIPKLEQKLAEAHRSLDTNALYAIWAGSNDLFALSNITDPDKKKQALIQISDQGTNNLTSALQRLHDLGARYLVLLNLPDLGLTPDGRKNPADTTTAAAYFNQQMLDKVNALPFDVVQLDIFTLLEQVVANGTAYGFSNVTGRCDKLAPGDKTCQGFLFFNEVHPSTEGQKIIGDYVLSVLTLPENALLLTQLPTSAVANQTHIIEQNLPPRARPLTPGKAVFFAGTDYSKDHNVTQLDVAGSDNTAKNNNVTTGLLYALNEALTTGAAFSYNHSTNKFDQLNASSVAWDAKQLALLANYRLNKAYINAVLSLGTLNFNEMHRRFYLGPHLEDAGSKAKGHLYSGHISAGFDILQHENFKTGPFLTSDYTSVTINAYTEKGAEAADIAFEKQKRGYLSASLGWEANFKQNLGRYATLTHVFVAGNRQWQNGDKDLHFHVGRLDGAHSTLPVITHNSRFVSTGINFATQVTDKFGLSLGYEFDKGNYALKQHNFMLNLQYQIN